MLTKKLVYNNFTKRYTGNNFTNDYYEVINKYGDFCFFNKMEKIIVPTNNENKAINMYMSDIMLKIKSTNDPIKGLERRAMIDEKSVFQLLERYRINQTVYFIEKAEKNVNIIQKINNQIKYLEMHKLRIEEKNVKMAKLLIDHSKPLTIERLQKRDFDMAFWRYNSS